MSSETPLNERLLAQRDFLISELHRLHRLGPKYSKAWRWITAPRGTSKEFKKAYELGRDDSCNAAMRILQHEIVEIIERTLKL